MAIPKFEDFLYPFMYILRDKEITKKEMKDALIKRFNLSEEDCTKTTKGGTAFQLDDRIGWCRQWLRRALFISIPKRGVYKITPRGAEYLKTHNDLRESDLLHYPEFAEYSGIMTSASGTEGPDVNKEVMTPTEMFDIAYKTIHNDLVADLLQKVIEMSPAFFEKLVLDLLLKMGYGGAHKEKAYVTPLSHDLGIDAVIPEDALGLEKILIQAKRYSSSNVGTVEFQSFVGAIDTQKATKGVFITTSDFSPKIKKELLPKISKKVVLINGKQLADFMIEYGVGVSDTKSYVIKTIDSDYFEE